MSMRDSQISSIKQTIRNQYLWNKYRKWIAREGATYFPELLKSSEQNN